MHPQNLIVKAVLFIRTAFPRFVRWGSRVGWWKVGIASAALILVIAGVSSLFGGSESLAAPAPQVHSVEVKSVAELSNQTSPLSVVGQVSSKSEATVRAERSGQVTGVYKTLGDPIAAGSVAAELENASERAAVLQAQGAVEAAEANLSKITGGARSEQRAILESNRTNASASLDAAQAVGVNTLLSAYATADNAIRGTTDKMFTNPEGHSPIFNVTSSDSQLSMKIENVRPVISGYLKRETLASLTLSASSNLSVEISATETEMRAIRSFLDMIISALNKGIGTSGASASTIATYLSEATAARTTLTTALSSLSGATQGLVAAKSALDVAHKNLEQGVTGGQVEDVAAAKAALKQAQGGLAAARANLEKTIIRAPISGTINSFSLKRGDYVQQSSPVLTVANNSALEIVAYVTENDAHDIAAGRTAAIEGGVSGVVTKIAPAIDPLTKKIEVRIGVSGNDGALINGQSVLVSITRARVTAKDLSRVSIPVSAIKIGSDETIVFTLDAENKLVPHPVIVGTLLGDRVVITEGLTLDMQIVTDARGLRADEKVELK